METTWTHGGEEAYTESMLRLLCHMGMLSTEQQHMTPRLFKETGEYEDSLDEQISLRLDEGI
jgi:hypothetical protein